MNDQKLDDKSVAGVVVHHADPELTSKTVASLLDAVGIERVYLVDNASGDDLADIATAANNSRLTLIRSESNLGFTGGNNRAVETASADGFPFALLVNSDATVDDDIVGHLLAPAADDPTVAMVVPTVFDENSEIESCGGEIALGGITAIVDPIERDVDWAPGAAILIRIGPFLEVGGFDDRFFLYYEDVDLSLRIRARNLRIVAAPKARVTHSRRGAAPGTSIYYGARNRLLLGSLHRDLLGFPLFEARAYGALKWRWFRHLARGERQAASDLLSGVRDYWTGRFGSREAAER